MKSNMDQVIKRLLKVALVGSPNVGKSTLLNKLVCGEISCVSNKVHTTRKNILGVYTQDLVQLKFYDSPGVITREHCMKHRLEDTFRTDPKEAAHQCDLIVVVVDASNAREQRRLNQGVIKMLNDHQDKKSILVLNKVDLVKDKRNLLDISTRLTQGCIENRLRYDDYYFHKMSDEQIKDLNLQRHVKRLQLQLNSSISARERPLHKYVIELEKPKNKRSDVGNSINQISQGSTNYRDENFDPNLVSYRNFSDVFSISALKDDGIDRLRNYLCSQAQPVVEWPHGPSYLCNLTSKELVHSIIRGRVMDEAKHAAPYTISFKYQRCDFDEMGSLHVNLILKCPEKYMVSMIIGDRGVTVAKIIDSARLSISKTLGCEVKLDIQVVQAVGRTQSQVFFAKSQVPNYLTRDSHDADIDSSGENDDDMKSENVSQQ